MMWIGLMDNPEFLRLALAVMGALTTFLGIVSAYVTWTGRARMQELKTKYAQVKAQGDNQAQVLAVMQQIVASNVKEQESHDRHMQAILSRMDESNRQTQRMIDIQQEAERKIAAIAQSIVQESSATRISVEAAQSSIQSKVDEALKTIDSGLHSLLESNQALIKQTIDNQNRHIANAELIQKTDQVVTRVETILNQLRQWLDKHATDEVPATAEEPSP